MAVLVAILIIATGLGVLTASSFWGVFGAVVLFLSLEGFYFPTRYELSAEGVSVARMSSRSVRPWDTFRRVYQDRAGLTLSPYRGRRFMEPYRAIRLLFDGGDQVAIVARVRASVGNDVEWLGATDANEGQEAQG
ncbi:MAG: hypothetical protein IT349_06945 [Candidatus Eisenbacteria bacterium]|nr:hypothetical protein [Candidatus Eisenbacteria bacterium]